MCRVCRSSYFQVFKVDNLGHRSRASLAPLSITGTWGSENRTISYVADCDSVSESGEVTLEDLWSDSFAPRHIAQIRRMIPTMKPVITDHDRNAHIYFTPLSFASPIKPDNLKGSHRDEGDEYCISPFSAP